MQAERQTQISDFGLQLDVLAFAIRNPKSAFRNRCHAAKVTIFSLSGTGNSD